MPLRDGVNDICAAYDAYHLTFAHHWNSFDAALCQHGSDLVDRCFFIDSDDFAAHDIAGAQPFAIDFADYIGLGDNTNDPAEIVNNGKSTDSVAVE